MNTTEPEVTSQLMSINHKPKLITGNIVIGKDILELLTGAMYNDPLTVYREYIQNAADAIDDAVQVGLLQSQADGKVEIWLDHKKRSVRIRDNGGGVPSDDFSVRLTSIGMSAKRGKQKRGFRGVGRLSGLGYCQEMIFRSRGAGDTKPREMIWNGRRLKELLRDTTFAKALNETIREIATVRPLPAEEYPEHFFEVELCGIVRLKNDVLMNEDIVRAYLSQVAPVPFAPDFTQSETINSFLAEHKLGTSIMLDMPEAGGFIYRPHSNLMRVSQNLVSEMKDVETFAIPDSDGNVAAVGWLLHHDYLGAISRASLVGGLRMRVGNIQVGDDSLAAQAFTESRFNSWSIGEIHIVSRKIIPNGRRDDFEANIHWHDLLGKLAPIGSALTKRCRVQSQKRLAGRRGLFLFEEIQKALAVSKTYIKLDVATDFISDQISDSFDELKKIAAAQDPGSAVAASLESWIAELSGPVAALKRSNRPTAILEFLPANQRTTFRKALELVLNLSPDPSEGSKLVEAIIANARRGVEKVRMSTR